MRKTATISIFVLTLTYLHLTLQLNSTIAIQQTNETFLGYLPLSDCIPPPPITPGAIDTLLVGPLEAFEAIKLAGGVTFWGPVDGGLQVLAIESQLLEESSYKQVVYFNSSLESYFPQRQVILSSFTPEGNIVLNYALISQGGLDQTSIEVQFNVTSNFSEDILLSIRNCLQTDILQLSYLGPSSFLALCPNSSLIFQYSPEEPDNADTIIFPYAASFSGVAPNPLMLAPGTIQKELWQAAVLVNGSASLLLCSFNQSEASCKQSDEDISWVSVVAARAWGLQESGEEQMLLSVLSLYPSLDNMIFPGTITSIYRRGPYIYVQSELEQEAFLGVFQGAQNLVNISLPGQVLAYGGEKVVVQSSNGSILLMTFILPYFTLRDNSSSSQSIGYSCSGASYQQQYSIIWTSFQFPLGMVLPLGDSAQQQALRGVYSYQLDEAFQWIGPDFQIFVENSEPIEITLLSSTVLQLTPLNAALLDVILSPPQLQPSFSFLTRTAQLILLSKNNPQPFLIARNPCSFSNTPFASQIGSRYIIQNDQGQLCICGANLQNCSLQSKPSTNLSVCNGSTRKFIYPLVSENEIVSVYVNGSVVLETFSGDILGSIQTECAPNDTYAILFPRVLRDDLLLVFCGEANYLAQYVLRQTKFLFNRLIPLYGFRSRPNGTFLVGRNFIYLQVEADLGYEPPPNLAKDKDCCVLRLDPNAFTVSVIVEVVYAHTIITVKTIGDTDIVYFNISGSFEGTPFLKVYTPSTWISFSNPSICTQLTPCPPASYQYELTFASLLYNLASTFTQVITFDLASAAISASPLPLVLPLAPTSPAGPEYAGQQTFNLSWVCGPVMGFWVSGTSLEETGDVYSLATNSVVTSNKLISLFESALQVIDLGVQLPGTTLSELLMVVCKQGISLFIKFSSIWLEPLPIIPVPSPACLYFAYSQINETAAEFFSSCDNLMVPTPFLTLVYTNSSSFSYSFTNFQAPKQLRRILSLIQTGEQPYILGFEEGPSKSVTGILTFCQVQCGQLYILDEVEFILDFDATMVGKTMIVASLDCNNLSFWVNPQIPSADRPVPPDRKLGYRSITGQVCDSIKIVKVTGISEMSLLLGCINSYFLLNLSAGQQSLDVVQEFAKFSNCDPVNKVKPKLVMQGDSIVVLVAHCLQSQSTLRTQEAETVTSPNSSISTAYLQVYTKTGPTCRTKSYPIRIVPLAVIHTLDTFALYQISVQIKILYEQLSGQLIDAYIDPTPQTSLTLTHLSKQPIYENLSLKIQNPYYHIQLPVSVSPQSIPLNKTITLVLQVIFVISNVMTLTCLICWLVFKRDISNRLRVPHRMTVKEDSDGRGDQGVEASLWREGGSPRSSVRKAIRRVTEIQLFQPRYQQS